MKPFLPALALALLPAAARPETLTLKLVCEGVHTQAAEPDYHARLAHEGGPAAGSDVGLKPQATSSAQRRIRVEINGSSGRVRLPAAMAHGQTDWLPISALNVTEEEITGHFSTGTFRTHRLRIDRQSGEIQLRGGGAFDGTCDKASDAPVQRKF